MLSELKIEEDVFIGLQIKKNLKNDKLQNCLSDVKKAALISFRIIENNSYYYKE